ncbi:3-dehydrosphinganine reductase [Lunasporangiospora selenospora]|uniref:3-dehydrosphinganine reductase n=1 Tax=Lunasporangiospora selenospora TaxID=979761 RepID=A0A9P6G0H9_9FUNG|nr:3-dehydrosphinganine reductase [Lunasporangiospora selenospora]
MSICANLFLALLASIGITPLYNLIKGSQFNPKGKHVYVTGGSIGLGRAVAIDLAKKGANVTIVARNEGPLKETIELMKKAAAARKEQLVQTFHYVSADVTDKTQAIRALDEAASAHGGQVPEIIITCAGSAIPKLFVEATTDEFEHQMKLNYFGTLYTVHEGVKRMVDANIKGTVVFVSSAMGLIGFAGYTPYSPTKFAVRGLAENLRNELMLYGIKTHIYYPGNMFTPGFENENKVKPLVTREIEGSGGLTPEDACKGMMKGLRKGYFSITTDFDTSFLRVSSKGVTPMNNVGLDYILHIFAPAGAAQFMWECNYKVQNFGKKMLKKEL